MRKLAGWTIALLVSFSGFAASSLAAAPEEPAQSRLLADTTAIRPGQPFRVGVMLTISPKWHLYWINPGDGGIPTTVELRLPEGFTAGPWQYPIPSRFEEEGGIVAFGYEDEALLVTTVTPPKTIESANVTIAAEANWLVCQTVCVPGDAKLEMTLPTAGDAAAAKPANEQIFAAWSERMPKPLAALSGRLEGITQDLTAAGELKLVLSWKDQPPAKVEWFPPASDAVSFRDIRVQTAGKQTTVTTAVERLAGRKVEPGKPLESVLVYTAAADQRAGVVVPVNLDMETHSAR